MSSKLFHTIVAVGITFGAASAVGCASPADGESTTATDNALTTSDPSDTPKPPADAADASTDGPGPDAFCDATWPTTKGGLHHHPAPACIDPTGACAHLGSPFECAPVDAHDVCGWDSTLSVCFNGAWVCKSGRMPASSCDCNSGDPCDPSTTATPTTH